MTTYVTTSMDTWDIISKKVYGDEHFIDALIAANLEHRKVVFFSAGVELRKLFKNPRAKPDGTKMFCSAFLNDARMCCFFANAIVKY